MRQEFLRERVPARQNAADTGKGKENKVKLGRQKAEAEGAKCQKNEGDEQILGTKSRFSVECGGRFFYNRVIQEKSFGRNL